MPLSLRSSRRRYAEYRQKLREKRRKPDGGESSSSAIHPAPTFEERKHSHKRSRTFFRLFREFWHLIAEHRRIFFVALFALSFSTLIGLLPLYGTKVVIDNVLGDRPLPANVARWIHIENRRHLLTFVAIAMVILSAISELVSLASRWQAT